MSRGGMAAVKAPPTLLSAAAAAAGPGPGWITRDQKAPAPQRNRGRPRKGREASLSMLLKARKLADERVFLAHEVHRLLQMGFQLRPPTQLEWRKQRRPSALLAIHQVYGTPRRGDPWHVAIDDEDLRLLKQLPLRPAIYRTAVSMRALEKAYYEQFPRARKARRSKGKRLI
jgi:hypothetical protein